MTTTHEKMLSELNQYYGSPASIQQVALDLLDQDIVDASSPFMFLLEASATNTQAAMMKFTSVARARYPKLATEYSELYHHMADADYLDRFAQPTATTVTLVMPTATLRSAAVKLEAVEAKRITLPKDTQFQVAGVDWYLHYPVNITISNSGGIQAGYDLSEVSPLYYPTLAIDYFVTNTVDGEMLVLHLPVEQLSVSTETYAVSPSTGFNFTRILDDNFYALRAYHRTNNGPWEELAITHSPIVYDPTVPTLQLTVSEQTLSGVLPDIYTTADIIGDSIRVDVYTTKGVIDMDLSDYAPGDFTARWTELDKTTLSPYVAPLASLTDLSIYGNSMATGGRDPLTFEQLKERVIYRSADNRASITFDELRFELADKGYQLSAVNNTLAGRQYLCSKALPPPTESTLTSPIGVGSGAVTIDDSKQYGEVLITNYARQTLTPDALFVYEKGTYRLLTEDERSALFDLHQDLLVQTLNESKYFYAPFFYILDKEDDIYSLRAYSLDSYAITRRTFVYANEDVWFTLITSGITIARTDKVYTLTVTVNVPEGLTNLHGQLRYTDVAGSDYRLNETSVNINGGVAVLTFEMDITYDINDSDRIEITNLFDVSGGITRVYADLVSQFDIFYYVESSTVANTDYDSLLRFPVSEDIILTNYEQCTVQFGKRLTRLHTPATATLTPPVYETYEEDVAMTYEEDVYLRDEDGQLVWTLNEDTGKPEFTLLHRAGEEMYGDNEQPLVRYPKGTAKVNEQGEYVILEEERLVWSITPLMLDARYYFANSSRVVAYRQSLINTAIDYLEQDIETLQPTLLARSELFYLPPTSKGEAIVGIEGAITQHMDISLSFDITYHLTPSAWESEDIKAEIENQARLTLQSYLYTDTYSHSELTKQLKGDASYVLGVEVTNPIQGYPVGTIKTPASQWSVEQKMVELSNGRLDIVDDIAIHFPAPIS